MKTYALIGTAMLVLALGCGGSGDTTTPTSSKASLTIYLGSNSDPDLQQAVVSVDSVDISANGSSWASVGSPKTTYDLMTLQGAQPALVSQAPVSGGTYYFRITWATTNYKDGARPPAYVYAAGEATGHSVPMPATTTFTGTVTVPAGGSKAVVLTLDPATTFLRIQGTATTYAFNSMGMALDNDGLAAIQGTVTSGSTALGGTEVLAEVVDGFGDPHILQRTTCNAAGQYSLDLLPTNLGGSAPYVYVVAMPSNGAQAFPAQGVGPYHLDTPGAVVTGADLDFSGLATSASITLTVNPQTPAAGLTVADLRQYLAFGVATQYLIVRSHATTIGTTQDTYKFAGLGTGYYGVLATRGDAQEATLSQVLVNPGDSANVTLTFP
ncbi:MAG TPA: DUF4382 domain-containing protein [Holophagaceae bacterium]|nr:DUF4382 domain-containing protein [Holophagaceae bacterium]